MRQVYLTLGETSAVLGLVSKHTGLESNLAKAYNKVGAKGVKYSETPGIPQPEKFQATRLLGRMFRPRPVPRLPHLRPNAQFEEDLSC